MSFKIFIRNAVFLILTITFCTLASCVKEDNPTEPANTNPYGSGNGKITFYKTQSVAGGVDIRLNNETKHDAYFWNSGAPGCDNESAVSFILPAGTYRADLSGQTVNCNYPAISLTEGQCKTVNYTPCIGTGGGGGGGTNCDWTYWKSLVSVVTSWGPYDLCGSQSTLRVKVTNNSNVRMDYKVCIKRTNGSWDCGAWFNYGNGGSETFYGCPATGEYYVWVRPSSESGNCSFPNP